MLWRTFVWTFRPPFEGGEWLRQMVRVGVDSIPVVFLTTMFTGMVLALQTYNGFQRVHAENFVGSVVALAMLRELSPVLVGADGHGPRRLVDGRGDRHDARDRAARRAARRWPPIRCSTSSCRA